MARTDGGDTLRREPAELHHMVAPPPTARAVAQSRNVELALDAPTAAECEPDPDRVRQAVDDLIDNALRHAPPGTTVHVGA